MATKTTKKIQKCLAENDLAYATAKSVSIIFNALPENATASQVEEVIYDLLGSEVVEGNWMIIGGKMSPEKPKPNVTDWQAMRKYNRQFAAKSRRAEAAANRI